MAANDNELYDKLVSMIQPAWHDRPTIPGLYVCIGTGRQRGCDVVLNLTDVDIERGAPFYTEAVYGPIPEREGGDDGGDD